MTATSLETFKVQVGALSIPPSDLKYPPPPPPLCSLPYTDPLPDLQHSTYFMNTLPSPKRCTKPHKSKADSIQTKKNVCRTLCWLCATHRVYSERDCKHARHFSQTLQILASENSLTHSINQLFFSGTTSISL